MKRFQQIQFLAIAAISLSLTGLPIIASQTLGSPEESKQFTSQESISSQ